jgi:quercetin 2,3-dioxygenase
MLNSIILNIKELGFNWETVDPFLFCVHHADAYPAGNEEMGPAASLAGRHLGQDFTLRDGWRMYHGIKIPGFPAHPHRGFETVTAVVRGFVDHSDSHGAAGRYGQGDVQWMTAGEGLQHAEMFPLINTNKDNTLELFQIWINLPKSRKFAPPFYKMLWAEDIPTVTMKDDIGFATAITIIAGELDGTKAPSPAPDSWAANPENEVAIWTINMQPDARWTIPPASPGIRRMIYFYEGESIRVAGVDIKPMRAVELLGDQEVIIESGTDESKLLLLQGKPINEPVVKYGPFVMNTQTEIQQAINDYRRTEFGGWPWPGYDNVHPRKTGRFAIYADGRKDIP